MIHKEIKKYIFGHHMTKTKDKANYKVWDLPSILYLYLSSVKGLRKAGANSSWPRVRGTPWAGRLYITGLIQRWTTVHTHIYPYEQLREACWPTQATGRTSNFILKHLIIRTHPHCFFSLVFLFFCFPNESLLSYLNTRQAEPSLEIVPEP